MRVPHSFELLPLFRALDAMFEEKVAQHSGNGLRRPRRKDEALCKKSISSFRDSLTVERDAQLVLVRPSSVPCIPVAVFAAEDLGSISLPCSLSILACRSSLVRCS